MHKEVNLGFALIDCYIQAFSWYVESLVSELLKLSTACAHVKDQYLYPKAWSAYILVQLASMIQVNTLHDRAISSECEAITGKIGQVSNTVLTCSYVRTYVSVLSTQCSFTHYKCPRLYLTWFLRVRCMS